MTLFRTNITSERLLQLVPPNNAAPADNYVDLNNFYEIIHWLYPEVLRLFLNLVDDRNSLTWHL